jgi:hypothetical protein
MLPSIMVHARSSRADANAALDWRLMKHSYCSMHLSDISTSGARGRAADQPCKRLCALRRG